MSEQAAAPPSCSVCAAVEEDPSLLSECYACGAAFHLNPRNDSEAPDCGDAVIGPSLGIHFYCNPCLEEAQAASGQGTQGTLPGVSGLPGVPGGIPGVVPGSAGVLPPFPPLPSGPRPFPGAAAPPPRRQRSAPRRRYRRIDRP